MSGQKIPNVKFYNDNLIEDSYGWARFPETIERIPYGRFRNVYLYITEQCQLRCGHCYMGERLERSLIMPPEQAFHNLTLWRKMGGSKLTILGGEPTLHSHFTEIIKYANKLGYEKVILTTNGLRSGLRKLRDLDPKDFAYIQVSLDGASSATHDIIRGRGTFEIAWNTVQELCKRGFDTRIICTVNKLNMQECLNLLPMADAIGVSLVKYHVFSGIGKGTENEDWLISPPEWIEFYEQRLEKEKGNWKTQIWYQPTYARKKRMQQYIKEGYQGCIGRTLDRISIFPDGRAFVCSYLFDTNLNFANMVNGHIQLNKELNEFDIFSRALIQPSCGNCKVEACMGGCPAEEIVMGTSSCSVYSDIIPVCRLWKSDS